MTIISCCWWISLPAKWILILGIVTLKWPFIFQNLLLFNRAEIFWTFWNSKHVPHISRLRVFYKPFCWQRFSIMRQTGRQTKSFVVRLADAENTKPTGTDWLLKRLLLPTLWTKLVRQNRQLMILVLFTVYRSKFIVLNGQKQTFELLFV